MAIASIAILMLAGCLFAKRFVINTAISRGLGTPISPLPGMVFTGLAFAAPIQSAFLLAFLPFSSNRRVAIACILMTIAMFAFAIGIQAHPYQDSPAIFSTDLFCTLPLFAFGWYIPLGLLNRLRGWQFSLDFLVESTNEKISISSLFGFTFAVSLCLFAIQLGPHGSYSAGLIGMLVGMVFGSFSSLAIYFIMKFRPIVSLICYVAIGVGTYFVARQILLAAGAGPLAYGNAMVLSAFVLAILSGLVLAKFSGVVLITRPGRIAG